MLLQLSEAVTHKSLLPVSSCKSIAWGGVPTDIFSAYRNCSLIRFSTGGLGGPVDRRLKVRPNEPGRALFEMSIRKVPVALPKEEIANNRVRSEYFIFSNDSGSRGC